jgi:glycosyltransferase involved in cell wall biosynthesis
VSLPVGTNYPLKPSTSRAISAADLLLAGTFAVAALVMLAMRSMGAAAARKSLPRTLLYFNSAYSLHRLRERRAEHTVTYRDLNGFFDHVWTVHPMVGADPDEPPENSLGPPKATRISERHTFVEATVGRFQWLTWLPRLNFVLSQVALLQKVHRRCRRGEIGIVRAADPYYNGLLALLLSRLYRLPLEVRIVANFDLAYEIGRLAYPRLLRWRWLEQRVARFTLSRADVVVTGSDDNDEFAVRNGARRSSLGRLGNWSMIDPVHLLEPDARPSVAPDLPFDERPSVISVGRLELVKHPEDVVRALAEARREAPDLFGVIVGDGSMRRDLERLRDELDLEEHLFLVGERDQHWLAGVLSRADVVAAPMAGLALVEAGLSGTPIVAYDIEWHSEILTQGESALIVPYRDTAQMARAICDLITDRSLARSIGRRGREIMLERMDPKSLVEQERAQAERLFGDIPRVRGSRRLQSESS